MNEKLEIGDKIWVFKTAPSVLMARIDFNHDILKPIEGSIQKIYYDSTGKLNCVDVEIGESKLRYVGKEEIFFTRQAGIDFINTKAQEKINNLISYKQETYRSFRTKFTELQTTIEIFQDFLKRNSK